MVCGAKTLCRVLACLAHQDEGPDVGGVGASGTGFATNFTTEFRHSSSDSSPGLPRDFTFLRAGQHSLWWVKCSAVRDEVPQLGTRDVAH